MKRLSLIVTIALMLIACQVFAAGTLNTGSLASGSGLTGTSNWAANMNISWNVSLLNNVYTYTYVFADNDTGQKKDISHIILQTSDNFSAANISGLKINDTNGQYELQTWTTQQGNPNIPASVYGLKIEDGPDASTWTVVFQSDKAPMWGNFYAKNGQTNQLDNTVWNTDFLIAPSDRDSFNSVGNYIAVPDTNVIPEMPSSLLGAISLIPTALVALKRRYR